MATRRRAKTQSANQVKPLRRAVRKMKRGGDAMVDKKGPAFVKSKAAKKFASGVERRMDNTSGSRRKTVAAGKRRTRRK